MNIYKVSLLLMVILFILPNMTIAADIGSINIQNATLSQNDSELQVAFSVKNISETQQEVVYGIRAQEIDGERVFEVPAGSVSLAPIEEVIQYATVEMPKSLSGEYKIFLLSRDARGLVSVLKYVGDATLEKLVVADEVETPTLESCEVSHEQIICSIKNADVEAVDVNYMVNNGSIYGPILTEGILTNMETKDEFINIPISDTLKGGDYTYRIWLTEVALAQNVLVHIAGVEADTEDAEPAFHSDISEGKGFDYMRLIIIILPIFLLALLLYVALRRPKIGMILLSTAGITASGIAFAAIALVDLDGHIHIFNGDSRDSGATQFVISLNKSKFEATEPITLSYTVQDTTIAWPPTKPGNSSVDISVDGGAWVPLVTAADSVIGTKTLSAISVAGTHTLSFRSPDLCGGAFGGSLFNFGIFGTTECLFSVTVDIVSNEPPTTPIIGGNCLLGVQCNIGIVSTDTDGGQLCYEADWPMGANTNAGCATEGNPVSVSYTFNSCDIAGTTVQAQATDTSTLQSSWGTGSVNVPNSIICTIPCDHCTYDGTEGDIGLSALPPFLPPDGVVEVSWALTNVATCAVVGRTVSSGAIISTWDWDTVQVNSSQSTTLDSATEYTLTCTDLDGDTKTESLIISTIPIWQEF